MANRGRVPTIDYSSRDADAIRDDLIDAIPFFLPEWTQHNDNDFGIALIRLFSLMGDVLHYYIDRTLNEGFLPTAIKRESVINHLSLIDYQMSRPTSALVELVFSLNTAETQDTIIDEFCQLSTSASSGDTSPVVFETLSSLRIPAEMLGDEVVEEVVSYYDDLPTDTSLPDAPDSFETNTIYYVSSENNFYRKNASGNWELVAYSDNIAVDPFETPVSVGDYVFKVNAEQGESSEHTFSAADGNAFERFTIPETPVIDGSVTVYVQEGASFIEYEIIESWLDASSSDRACVLYTDSEGNVTIEFGNDIQGRKLVSGNIPKAEYRLGGGLEGNVGANTIVNVDTPALIHIYEDFLNKVTATCSNPIQATGGDDQESIEEAKIKGPQSLKTLYRAVNKNDFKIIAESIDGVAKAAVLEQSISNSCGFCGVTLSIYPSGGGEIPDALRQRIEEEFNEKSLICTKVSIADAEEVEISIIGDVYGYVNYSEDTVEDNLLTVIDEYFDQSLTTSDFNQPVYLSDIMAALDNTSGVDHVDLSELTRVPNPIYEIRSGDWGIQGFTVGDNSTHELWTIVFTGSDSFNVEGSVSGINASGTVDAEYSSDNEEISFTVVSGEQDAKVGDTVTFKTSPKIGNIITSGAELPIEGPVELDVIIPEEGREAGACE